MVELCGARARARHDRRRRRRARRPARLRLRDARVAAPAGHADPARAQRGDPRRARLRARAADAAGRRVDALVPHWRRARRHPRGRPDRGGRADRRRWSSLPATLPARPDGGAAGLTPTQRAAAPRRGRARRRAACYEILGWSFTDARRARPAAPARRRPAARASSTLPTRCPRTSRCCARLLLGLAARRRAPQPARGAGDVALFETGSGLSPTARQPEPLPDERRHARRRCSPAAAAAGDLALAAEPRAPTSSRRRRALAAVLDALRVDWRVGPGATRAVPASGRSAAAVAGERRRRRLARRAASARRARVGAASERRAFEIDLDAVARAGGAGAWSIYEDVTIFPAVRQDLASSCRTTCPPRGVLEVVRQARRRAARRGVECSTLPRRRRSARARCRSRCHLEFRAPDRTLTDEEVDERRAAIAAALRASWGASSVADIGRHRRRGLSRGALAAQLLWRHPFFELGT